MGLMFACANLAGIISSNVYPSHAAPRFFGGHGVAVGSGFITIVCAIILTTAYRLENARRDRMYGPAAADGSDATSNKILTPEQRRSWGLEGLTQTEIIELGDKHPGMASRNFGAFCGTCIMKTADPSSISLSKDSDM
jgi:MFS transporter, ACS family, DAL5 transporter family protein